MTRIVVSQSDDVGKFVAERAHCTFDPVSDRTIGVVDEETGLTRGGVIVTGYTGVACFLHTAGTDEMWATRDFLWAMFDYVFNILGCARVFGVAMADDVFLARLHFKLGFYTVALIPGLFPAGDGVIVCMERRDCRWLKLKPRSTGRVSASGNDGEQNGWWQGQGASCA